MLFSKGYKRTMQSKVGRAAFRAFGGAKGTKYRYRLYADGTIIDQETNNPVGYIVDNLDEVYKMKIGEQQRYIKEFLSG